MADYRILSLVNGNNATWTLADPKTKVFGTNIAGFGFSTDASFLRLGDDQLLTYEQYSMVEKTMDIIFYDDTLEKIYKKYNDFIKFLSFKDIYLLYQTPASSTSYRMKVQVSSLSKGEVSPDNSALTCALSLIPLSFWEDNIKNTIEVSNDAGEGGKAYPLERPYFYAASSASDIQIETRGTINAPVEISIIGEATNPQYSLFDENDNLIGIGRFVGTFDSVYVNSDEAEETIILMQNGVALENPYNYQDLTIGQADESYITFIKLQTGVNKIAFTLDAAFEGSVKVEWRNRYVSV